MKILGLGLDQTILDKNSALAQRAREYSDLVEKYVVIVPAQSNQKVVLSDKVMVYGVKASNKIFTLLAICKLGRKILKGDKFDVITAQDQYFLAWVAYRLARQFKNGLEIQVHGFEKFYGLRKIIAKFVLPRANVVRVVSQRLKKQLIKDFSVKENNIVVVPIYVDTSHNLSKIDRQDDKFIFMTASRLVPVKNIGMQIDAMNKLSKEHDNVELQIFGQGPVEGELRAKVKLLKLEDKVIFKGWVDNLEKYYQQADVFVLSSNAEGWGMVIVKAASIGLPIIMTDVGCAGEVIKDQESGLVVPVGDTEVLYQAMKNIITDNDLRNKITEGGRQAVQQLLNKDQTLDLYKQSWKQTINE
ncbi:glycosyltransferase family 4 protein [Candidatus Parcubacteria bacterium]|jgi:glycosyltransferase involved in cell wall biosynthesis|nr:glycosyltransferase family 4 protein [Candidatus Parcubacteria bacterium]